ncbi:MAG: methyltransferase domain-containing protein [Pseudomonadota bacterium]
MLQRRQDSWLMVTLATATLLSACGNTSTEEQADPLPPPPYGEEEKSNFEVWLDTMELSSRELYSSRDAVLEALQLKESDRVADIGSGTGIYSLLFSDAVGPDGIVFAVDIEPRFLSIVTQRVADEDLENVVAVLSRQDDVTLPKGVLDVAFVADTYHYFKEPDRVMRSVHEALADDGRVFVLDYEFVEGGDSDPSRDHLRFGKDDLVSEVEGYGFRLKQEIDIPGMSEFYVLEFDKNDGLAEGTDE